MWSHIRPQARVSPGFHKTTGRCLRKSGPSRQIAGVKFGIIGTGMIGALHARAISGMRGGELRSVFNHRIEGAEKLGAEYGVPAYDDLAAFLTDPELEAVTVCTPSGAHCEPALAALRAGRHVLVEKPLEVSTARVDRLMDAARESGKTLASVLNRRFTPAMDAFRTAVADGRFGRITSASCQVKWFRDQAYYDSAAWRGTWALDGGGALMNQAIHAIDALLHLAGPVRRVSASTACLAHGGIEVEDIGVAVLEFENGARGVIEGATCCWSSAGHPVRIQICGTAGSVFLADETFECWDFREPSPTDENVRSSLMKGAGGGAGANNPASIGHLQHRRNFEDFADAIREGREPSTSAASARPAVALIEAIYRSARESGRAVEPE
jgi:UDP-N-acetyl-2-amino-2-deoxyglucuronate dehydrogenase